MNNNKSSYSINEDFELDYNDEEENKLIAKKDNKKSFDIELVNSIDNIEVNTHINNSNLSERTNNDYSIVNNSNINEIRKDKTYKYFNQHLFRNSIHIDVEDITKTVLTRMKIAKDLPSYLNISSQIIRIGFAIMFSMIITDARQLLLLVFSKNYGISMIEALSSFTTVYNILVFGLAWALSQGYGFIAAQYASSKDYVSLGKLTNKVLFINFFLGIMFGLFSFFLLAPIFATILSNPEAIKHINYLWKYFSIGITPHMLQVVLLRYFCAVEKNSTLIYASVVSLVTQVIFMLIFILGFNDIDLGVGLSFSLGNYGLLATNLIIYLKYNPYPEVLIKPTFKDIFEGMLSYILYALGPGSIIFLNIFSYQISTLLATIQSDKVYATMGLLQNALNFTFLINEAVTSAGNVLINFSIGEKNKKKLVKSFLITFIFIFMYTFVVCILLVFFNYNIYSIFTNSYTVLNEAKKLNKLFVILFFLFAFHNLLSETLTALGEKLIPNLTTILGRYIIVIGLSLILIKVFNYGDSSIYLASIVAQIIITALNSGYIVYILSYKTIEEIEEASKLN